MRTLVLGIGNPLLADDGVGLEVARRVRARVAGREGVVVEEACAGGLAVAERLVGYERALLVDAAEPRGEPGAVRLLAPGAAASWNTGGPHDARLPVSMKLLADLGEPMPSELAVVAVEAADLGTFSERLTAPVERAVPEAVARVLEWLGGAGAGGPP